MIKRLRVGKWGGVDVVEWRPAPQGSVLAGQLLRCFVGNYETEAAALAAHPDANGYSNPYTDPQVSLGHLPDENTPAAGGMWPDDIGGPQ